MKNVALFCGALGFGLAAPLAAQTSQPSSAPSTEVRPPTALTRVEAAYPPAALSQQREALVVLKVTISREGVVTGVALQESGGQEFDQAAILAVMQWRFTPAYRGDTPIESKLSIPFRFTLPSTQPTSAPASAPSTTKANPASDSQPSTAPSSAPSSEPVIEVVSQGKKSPPPRAVSDFVLSKEVLTIAPKPTAEEMLEAAPGVYVAKSEGEAVAGEIFLRGFDAEHGQDIELNVSGIPINMPSHIHGQGYADIGFVIPEVVLGLRVTEGVYDPRQGDFAVAGSINFDLGVKDRGYQFGSTFGSFNTFRQVLVWAPENESEETFAAVSVKRTNGFGENRGGLTGSAIAQYDFDLPNGYHGLFHVAAYGSRFSFPGVLRLDDIEDGLVDFYGRYDDPSAAAQSAFTTRTQSALTIERASERGDRTGMMLWFILGDFRLRQNFTGYTEKGQQNIDFSGRGDLIEQRNQSTSFGAKFYRRSPRLDLTKSISGNLEVGLTLRNDNTTQIQNLLAQPQNEIWDKRVDATINGSDIGTYADLDLRLPYNLKLRGGFRADVLYYNIDDRLGNFIPQFGIEDHFLGFTRGAIGVAAGPRATLQWEAMSNATLMLAYGEGYRSPQARILGEGEEAPYTKVRSAEIGATVLPLHDDRITVNGALYGTFLSDDLAFDPGEGGLTFIGPTRRLGAVLHSTMMPVDWLLANLSITGVRATLVAPPLATADNPSPPFEKGQLLPFVPPVVVRADVGLRKEDLFQLGARSFDARFGVGNSFLSSRPLPYSELSAPVFVLDASASLASGRFSMSLDALNVLNNQYAAAEYSFVSDWANREIPSFVPVRHISAGAPLTVMLNLSIGFEAK